MWKERCVENPFVGERRNVRANREQDRDGSTWISKIKGKKSEKHRGEVSLEGAIGERRDKEKRLKRKLGSK